MATTYAARARRLGDRFAGAAKSGLWTSVYTIQSSIRFLYTVAGILAGGTQVRAAAIPELTNPSSVLPCLYSKNDRFVAQCRHRIHVAAGHP